MPGAAAPGRARVRSLDSGWNRASGWERGKEIDCAERNPQLGSKRRRSARSPETPPAWGPRPGKRSPESTDVAFRLWGRLGGTQGWGCQPWGSVGPCSLSSHCFSPCLPPLGRQDGSWQSHFLLGPGEGQRACRPLSPLTENIKGTRRGELSPERR